MSGEEFTDPSGADAEPDSAFEDDQHPYRPPEDLSGEQVESADDLGQVADDRPDLPNLYRDRAFWGMTSTQFLGAFNDNLFKQLILLLSIPAGAGALVENDMQGVAMVVFSLPFVLFSGFAGYLSDRFSKTPIIVGSKVAEIVVMSLGVLAFASYELIGYGGLLCVLFLMGTQSSFFGPGKYGILPEMLRERDLPRANGFILMTTFLAIIFGTAAGGMIDKSFGPGDEVGAGRLWLGCLICVVIAGAGTCTSLMIRRVRAAKPELKFQPSALAVPPETRALLRRDRPLVLALLASCMFWLVSGVAIQAVNALGLLQLGLDEFQTSVVTASIGVGIAIGAPIVGRLCHGRPDFRLVRIGAWGITLLLIVMSVSLPGGQHMLGRTGSIAVLMMLGVCAAMFAIPVQVFIQARPPLGMKGRMIALMNQANFVAIMLSGIIYIIFDRIVVAADWPRAAVFGMMVGLILPVAVLYRPRNDVMHAPNDD